MPGVNEIHPYNYGASQFTEFDKKGHPGKFLQSITCTTGVTTFTGSNYGVGAIIVNGGTVGTASLSAGGTIPLQIFTGSAANGNAIIEISLSSVKVDSGTVYALIRNQLIR